MLRTHGRALQKPLPKSRAGGEPRSRRSIIRQDHGRSARHVPVTLLPRCVPEANTAETPRSRRIWRTRDHEIHRIAANIDGRERARPENAPFRRSTQGSSCRDDGPEVCLVFKTKLVPSFHSSIQDFVHKEIRSSAVRNKAG